MKIPVTAKLRVSLLIILLFFFKSEVNAQSAFSSFWKLSCPEKWWVIGHPFVAGKAYKITIEARIKSDSLLKNSLLDADPYGGQVDAVRHTYWMARLAQSMKWKKAIRLGEAHEKANHIAFRKMKADEEGIQSDSISSVMDLYNNRIGVAIGCNFKSASNTEIYNYVIENLTTGKLKVIFKDKNGNALDCAGNVLEKASLSGKWNTPKCLVNSSYLSK